MTEERYPIVFIGAGPGDPELITVKGQRVLSAADRIIYAGSLVPEALLTWAKPEAEIFNSASMDLKQIVDSMAERRKFSGAQLTSVENTGVLLASGLIAGEALMGLIIAIFAVGNIFLYDLFSFFERPPFWISAIVLVLIAWVLVQLPIWNAGKTASAASPGSKE